MSCLYLVASSVDCINTWLNILPTPTAAHKVPLKEEEPGEGHWCHPWQPGENWARSGFCWVLMVAVLTEHSSCETHLWPLQPLWSPMFPLSISELLLTLICFIFLQGSYQVAMKSGIILHRAHTKFSAKSCSFSAASRDSSSSQCFALGCLWRWYFLAPVLCYWSSLSLSQVVLTFIKTQGSYLLTYKGPSKYQGNRLCAW